MNRRYFLHAAPLALLAGCATDGTSTVSLDQVKQYIETLADAITAAAQAYIASSGSDELIVQQIVDDLQTAKQAALNATAQTDVRGIALQVIAAAQTLEPIVVAFLGPAAPYVPLALAVIQAFVLAIPPPPNAPPVPPAQLRAKAAQVKRAR